MQIEYLRRRYAQAVDSVCQQREGAENRVSSIFSEIFIPEARIRYQVEGTVVRESIGPEGWASIVCDAVGKYSGTQHLIGTQLVRFESLEITADNIVRAGVAEMVSHVRAWHWCGDRLRIVAGDYRDSVCFRPSSGWRIARMDLVQAFSLDVSPVKPIT